MTRTKLFSALSLTLAILASVVTYSQTAKVKTGDVELIDWKFEPCDNTYNPYMLVNRITQLRNQNSVTYLTVNFRDNCCAEFKPYVEFKNNRLLLQSYKEYSGSRCDCDCCFSIEFKLAGLPISGYETYFNGKKVEVSNDYYPVVAPTSVVYKGATINRRNRYGFKEGMWMTFYDDGKIETLEKFPEQELYDRSRSSWKKMCYPSGKLSGYSRKDTVEMWFEDGTLERQFIDYKKGDTVYEKNFIRYQNHQIQKNSLERRYPFIFRSELDPKFESNGSATEVLYMDEFFEDGKPQYRFGKDTTFTWHPSGVIASREFGQQRIEYDERALVRKRDFHWKTKGPTSWGDMNNSLYATIGPRGTVLKIHFVRDEQSSIGISGGVAYDWIWDERGKLIASPEKWQGEFPWRKFKQLKVLLN